jgi:hypothetical protein
MTSVQFLYAALAAFVIIHGTYLTILIRRYGALSDELKELGKSGRSV